MIGNYELTREQAEQVPFFYHPELAEADLPKGIRIVKNDYSRECPQVVCSVNETALCTLTLRREAPLIMFVDLVERHEKFEGAKKRLEEIFGFELTNGR